MYPAVIEATNKWLCARGSLSLESTLRTDGCRFGLIRQYATELKVEDAGAMHISDVCVAINKIVLFKPLTDADVEAMKWKEGTCVRIKSPAFSIPPIVDNHSSRHRLIDAHNHSVNRLWSEVQHLRAQLERLGAV
jgi:hypothetical protein